MFQSIQFEVFLCIYQNYIFRFFRTLRSSVYVGTG